MIDSSPLFDGSFPCNLPNGLAADHSAVGGISLRIEFVYSRFFLLGWLSALFMFSMRPQDARAETYPTRAIHIVVPFPPGGTVDPFARLAADRLSRRLGQPVIVENIAGATGAVGTTKVARALPDGYTLLFAFSSHVVIPSLFTNLPYDPIGDFEPITLAVATTHVLTVTPSFPASTKTRGLSAKVDTPTL